MLKRLEGASFLHIVLFGLPGAGKTSLLAALGQADQTHELLLHDESSQPTGAEVVPCSVTFHENGEAAVRAVVVDCAGRLAQKLIAQPDVLEASVPHGTLAGEMARAETLILAVDASVAREHLDADFAAFERFLRTMEEGRSARADVGGLPVFLVLTKCDLLAAPADKTIDWIERIEQRKREVDEHFRAFLTLPSDETRPRRFGQLDLHLWATAVQRPALAGAAAKSPEPYGVAELFRQCVAEASAYRQSCCRCSRRLFWTTWGGFSLVGALILLALFLVFRPGMKPPTQLEQTIEVLQFADKATPAERLHAPLSTLRQRRARLRLLQENPEFAALPEKLRTFVTARHNELNRYIEWVEQVQAVRRPVTVDTEAGLREIEEQLEKLHPRHSEEWQGTEGARFYRERLDAVKALLDGVERVQAAYLGDAKKALSLWSFDGYRGDGGINWRLWSADLEDLRSRFKPVLFRQRDQLPGMPTLTYASVMRLDTAIEASTLRQRLDRVRNLCAALGLIDLGPDKPPLLAFDKLPAFNLSLAKPRWEQLQKAYPDYKAEFVREGLPEPLVRELDRAVPQDYDSLLQPARELVLTQLRKAAGGDEEPAARWHAVREWLLRDPEELAAWRSLAMILKHLLDPAARDPVTALAAFLGEKTFTLEIERIVLELPDGSPVKVPATAALSIHHPRGDGKEAALIFEQSSEPKRDPERRATICTFVLKKGQRIEYRPGDDLWMTLPVRNNLQLTWGNNRSTMYQFDCLLRPPRLQKAGKRLADATGEQLGDVRVTVSPPAGWPRVPDLMPVVRLGR